MIYANHALREYSYVRPWLNIHTSCTNPRNDVWSPNFCTCMKNPDSPKTYEYDGIRSLLYYRIAAQRELVLRCSATLNGYLKEYTFYI
jgi:hypothetical protein